MVGVMYFGATIMRQLEKSNGNMKHKCRSMKPYCFFEIDLTLAYYKPYRTG